jgi:serine protease
MARPTVVHAPSIALVVTSAVLLPLFMGMSPASGQGRHQIDAIRRSRRPIPSRYIVAVRAHDDPDAVAGAAQSQARGRVRRVFRHAFRGFAIETSEATARALAADPGVAYVEEDGVIQASNGQSLDGSDNWGLDRVDQRAIGADGAGYDHMYRYAAEGSGVHVYVLDTGIRTTHVEFGGRAFSAFDTRPYENVTGDCHGHGTHVAGIIGGARFGVAKLVTLHSVRVLGCDLLGYVSDLITGIDWVTAYHVKPAVINMSIQAALSDATNDAIRGAVNAGVTFVGAAGNQNADSCAGLMGGVPDALVVGASGYSDAREWYSNYGRCVDLFAPGGNIASAAAGSDTGWTWMSGTSMAAPHVAGAAALYLEDKPHASPQEVAGAIITGATVGAIRDRGAGSPNRLLFTAYLGDRTRPTVSIMQPLRRARVHGTQTLSVAADDDVGIASVQFWACGVRIGSDSVAPFAMDWDSTESPDGPCEVDVQAYDLAANVSTARVPVLVANKHDETPPQLTLRLETDRIWPSNGKLVPVTVTGVTSDDESTITSVSFVTRDEYGSVQPSGVAAVTNARFRFTVDLAARRLGHDRDGRRYQISVTAADAGGNSATVTADVVVRHDRRR